MNRAPVKFRDPTGHQACEDGEQCEEPPEWWIQLLSDPEFQAWLASLSEDLIWELVPSAFGVYADIGGAFGACFEGGMSDQFSLQLNWRSGELTFLYGPSADLYVGTPRVVSLSAGAGGVWTWGASRNAALKGFNAYTGVVGQVDLGAELGAEMTQSTSLTTVDTNANGKEEIALYVDPVSGKYVRSLQVGLAGGINGAPTIGEFGVVGGVSFSRGFNLMSNWKVVNPVAVFAPLLAVRGPR